MITTEISSSNHSSWSPLHKLHKNFAITCNPPLIYSLILLQHHSLSYPKDHSPHFSSPAGPSSCVSSIFAPYTFVLAIFAFPPFGVAPFGHQFEPVPPCAARLVSARGGGGRICVVFYVIVAVPLRRLPLRHCHHRPRHYFFFSPCSFSLPPHPPPFPQHSPPSCNSDHASDWRPSRHRIPPLSSPVDILATTPHSFEISFPSFVCIRGGHDRDPSWKRRS
mmetsp:Transcript_28701/g.60605  ORF Transcript_28701/g.60605 Transcript_28701/m.60605 type:complete len:221 (+) Transcript_28701:192-854(+)